jgi:hypothetical protein
MATWIILGLVLIAGPGGQEIAIYPDKIVSLRTPRGGVHKDVKCVLHTVDSKFISAAETCKAISQKLGR